MADVSGNNANYYTATPYPIDSGKYTTVVGEFQNSDSPYGTFDQGGNVWEWNEASVSVRRVGCVAASIRSSPACLSTALSNGPTDEDNNLGFRVASVPEPGSLAMLAGIALTALLCWWRKRA